MKYNWIVLILILLLWACDTAQLEETTDNTDSNPPAEGFNEAGSDTKAIALADSVMAAMGGRQAWDQTRFIAWNFFGARSLLWDKKEGDVRIEIPRDSSIFWVNIFDKTGRARIGSNEITEPDSLQNLMDRAEAIWINDSYWLVMPFKLKDNGVTLKYLGQDSTQDGTLAEVVELTFEGVGNTPQNKYHVYIDPDSKLVTQWDYFTNAEDEEPRFSTPWADYQQYGEILLSGDRGQRQITEIEVLDDVPEETFR